MEKTRNARGHKKLFVILCCAVIGVLLVVGVVWIGKMIGASKPLPQPTGLTTTTLANGNTMVSVDKLPNATGYLFSVTEQGATTPTTLKTTLPEFDATLLLQSPNTYTISCQYLGAQPTNASQIVSITHTTIHQLATPQIAFADGILSVTYTDTFTQNINLVFTLYYTVGLELKTSTAFVSTFNLNNTSITGTYNLAQIIGQSGQFEISVQVSTTNNNFFSTSLPSNKIVVDLE